MSNGITIFAKSIHHLDIDNNDSEEVNISESENDFGTYLKSLAEKVISKSNDSRKFKFRTDSTEVRTQISRLMDDSNLKEPLNKISDRLLDKEVDAQDEYSHITEIQRGSLLQALLEIEGDKYFILTKVDHDSFLDEDDLKKHIGLPFESYVLKACIIQIQEEEIVSEINVFDTQSKIAEYWWKDFLELKEINTNEHNTRLAFTSIQTHLNRRLKNYYPADYTFIRNGLVSYFRTHQSFNYEEMVNYVIGDYDSIDPDLDVDDLKKSVNELPEKRGFDKSFQIIEEVVKARYSRTISLDTKIDLKLKENIENLEDRIFAEKSEEGEKFIKIATDKGYEIFKSRGKSNGESQEDS